MSFKTSPLFLTAASVLIIIFAVVTTAVVENQKPSVSSFQVITVGPVWNGDTWGCTSDKDFIVHGALRGLAGARLSISITGLGTQSLYQFGNGTMEAFTVGSPAGHAMIIARSVAPVSGWLTLETQSDAKAGCIQK